MESKRFWEHCGKDKVRAFSVNHDNEEYGMTYEELYQHFAERFAREEAERMRAVMLEAVDNFKGKFISDGGE